MIEFFAAAPKECLWYIFVFVAGLFFPQVRLGDLIKAFRTGSEPKTPA